MNDYFFFSAPQLKRGPLGSTANNGNHRVDVTPTPWWSIASTVASALATVALTGFAAVEISAERARRRERERSTDARIGAIAFLARRQLRSWLGTGQGSPEDFETWIRDAQNAGMLARHLDVAEARFVEILSLVPEASSSIKAAARKTAVYFFSGANRLNTYVATPRPDGIEVVDWVSLRDNAWKDFRDSVGLIDNSLGVDGLLREARILDAKRAADTPSMDTLIGKFADGLSKLSESSGGGAA